MSSTTVKNSLSLRAQNTALLVEAKPGHLDALDQLMPLIYEELRLLARRQLEMERQQHTLNTTALVHEAYLRLVDDTRVTRQGQAYFFGAASRVMRQILIDYARRRNANKRGGGKQPLSLTENQVAVDEYASELLDLDQALDKLSALNTRHAQIVECRFFGGLTTQETADVIGVSTRTVEYDWYAARAWLYNTLHGKEKE